MRAASSPSSLWWQLLQAVTGFGMKSVECQVNLLELHACWRAIGAGIVPGLFVKTSR